MLRGEAFAQVSSAKAEVVGAPAEIGEQANEVARERARTRVAANGRTSGLRVDHGASPVPVIIKGTGPQSRPVPPS